jgi:hypothetical protein
METGIRWSEYSDLLTLLHKTSYERFVFRNSILLTDI